MVVLAREERTPAAIALMALAMVFFTGIDTSAKWLVGAGLPVIQVVFTRYCGHFLFACMTFVPREGLSAFASASPRRQLLRSAFLAASTLFNFAALAHLPITITTTIYFAGPVLVTLLAIPILQEKVGIRRIIAVCVGFCGVLVVTQPLGAGWHPAMGFSLCSLFCASMYFIMTRMLAGTESSAVSQLWASGLGALLFLPFAVAGWVWPDGLLQWVVFLIIGGLGLSGHICANTAHRWADASILAPVVYVQFFLAAIVGVVIFQTWPSPWTVVGGLIIIASGLYIWMRERKAKA